MTYFVFLFSIYAWLFFFDDVYRFLTILTRHLTFIKHGLTHLGAPLKLPWSWDKKREKRAAAKVTMVGLWWPCNSCPLVFPQVCGWGYSRFILKGHVSVQFRSAILHYSIVLIDFPLFRLILKCKVRLEGEILALWWLKDWKNLPKACLCIFSFLNQILLGILICIWFEFYYVWVVLLV